MAAGAQSSAPFTLPPPADAADALRLSYYAYDRDLPLNAEVKPLDADARCTRYSLAYDSIHDQRVTAILAIPKHFEGPYPAVLLVHGSGGHKDTSYIHVASETLTGEGYATLSIDTQYHGDRVRPGRSGEIHMPDSYTMRDAWVQSVVDLRRAVDYLETRSDMDRSKIGYMGVSQGAMLGSVFGGVEARVACFCLAVPGGGLVNIVKHIDRYPVLKAHWPIVLTPEVLKKVEDIAQVTDPIYFIGRIAPRPLLILVANQDEIIPPEATEALIAAAHAKEPEQVKRWESGHVLNPGAFFDARAFFVAHLGKRTPKT
jgi:cephalosporin-C deacetylase-like acetyl esterase